jgi:ATP-dependent Lon protease
MTESDQQLPLLPLRDVVVYPHMVLPLFVGRERSIDALEHAMLDNKQVLLVRNAMRQMTSPAQTTCIRSAPCPISYNCSSCPTARSKCW